ncbi:MULTISPECIES: mycothiol transferase [Cellulomonas]|uniref:mycothiol transferase n=1 Tax=Cellulomonas TaxID=1707 RepID=UPI0010A92EE4|nr:MULTISPECIES: DUF664 domain-containing protein [Cellulomonas]
MRSAQLLADGFGRIGDEVRAVLDGADEELLTRRPDPRANTLAWLVWHLARVQDAQVAPLAGVEEVWTSQGWAERLGLPFEDAATGYGQSPEEVGQVRAPADLLLGYLDAATAATLAYLERLTDDDLDVVVDEDWDPPVTLGVRLVSILADDLQHVGQAAYVRGLLDRAG